jgi:hypothetical protein
LFLDDDPARAAVFLRENPAASWVETVDACLARLEERWDEVHLDHDLGGMTLVDSAQVDCGMEVIRWLCKEPRTHLNGTRFFVHTHNTAAGLLMVLQMRASGYDAELRPFGFDLARWLECDDPAWAADGKSATAPAQPRRRWLDWLPWRRERPTPSAKIGGRPE